LFLELLLPERARERRQPAPASATPAQARPKAGAPVSAVLLAALLAGAAPAAAAAPADALKLYREGRFAEAQKAFEQLAAQDKRGDARLLFNAGGAAYRATNYTAAAQAFKAVLAAPDLRLQQAAYYNLGNTQFRLGETAEDLDALQSHWEAAIKSFESAAKLDPTDADAAHNVAFVKAAVEQVKRLREAALQARAAADQSLRQRQYRRAREIMEALLQQNIAAKPFKEFTEKLKHIDEIANPPSPAAPVQP
jgi:tetratricopeptide (TPR) repeat protein